MSYDCTDAWADLVNVILPSVPPFLYEGLEGPDAETRIALARVKRWQEIEAAVRELLMRMDDTGKVFEDDAESIRLRGRMKPVPVPEIIAEIKWELRP
jgi:hypothetical protein